MPRTTNTQSTGPRRPIGAPRKGLYRRFFAWLLSRLQERYGAEVDQRKRDMLGTVFGTVVEIGAGAGVNLSLYPHGVHVLLVEPNVYMHRYLREAAARAEISAEVRGGVAECMDVADSTADFVVCTLVLCSVDDQEAAVREAMRVLKPGGTFLFMEHVAAPHGSRLRRRQARWRRLWRKIGDGCTLDRETGTIIERAGFRACRIERFEADTFALVRPHIAGTAIKP